MSAHSTKQVVTSIKLTNWIFRLLTLLLAQATSGQTKTILTAESFIDQIKLYHPVARQANLLVERAAASLLAARGNFDPVFSMNNDNKTLTGTDYYRYENTEIKIPTAAGIAIKSGIENATGVYTNPELTKGAATYLGIEVPLLKGLLIDKQRGALRQAKIYKDLSVLEKSNMLNDLLYDAYNAYWQWAAATQLYDVYSKYAGIAQKRLNLVRISYVNGDRALSDTIEAFTQLQNYRIQQNEAAIALNTRYYELSAFLWNETQQPYLLSDTYIPDIMAFNSLRQVPSIDTLEGRLVENHPQVLLYKGKIRLLEIDRKVKFQNILPSFDLKANLLSKGYFDKLNLSNNYLNNNYKIGFSIKTPLFLRQARGEYRETKLKIKETDLQLAQKTWELRTKLRRSYAEYELLARQLETVAGLRANYENLLKLEEMKFAQGESSLFIINSRESKLLESDQKITEIKSKYLKSIIAVEWLTNAYQDRPFAK